MMWWRMRRLALTGLLAATLAAAGMHVWFQTLPALEGSEPSVVISDGSVELGGHLLRVSSTRWGQFDAPEGSTTFSVVLDARSDQESALCGDIALAEANGSRVWLQAHRDLDATSDDEWSCQEDSRFYGILAVFLLPEDASGPFWLDVPIGSSEVLRFRLDG